ncbi:MAG TPA: ChaB family protein [Gammaproteobacteria bacterium]|nr:ChaB family protein [Gammaproteobacteria bacterium]
MPYDSRNELPEQVKDHLPDHAQDIYKEAFNSAWDQYEDPESRDDPNESQEAVAHQVAWNAVEQTYKKGDDGDWHKKD